MALTVGKVHSINIFRILHFQVERAHACICVHAYIRTYAHVSTAGATKDAIHFNTLVGHFAEDVRQTLNNSVLLINF